MPKTRTSGIGRPKGIPNKLTSDIKGMILAALDAVGGADYLKRQAEENPGPFMALVGKILPTQLNLDAKVSLELLVTQAISHAALTAVANGEDVSDTIVRH
jgi:hypothetical protein